MRRMRRRLGFLLAAVLAEASCAARIPVLREGAAFAAPPADAHSDFARALEEQVGVRFWPHNRVTLAENGAVFDAMTSAITRARGSVNIVTFIWRPSAPSDQMLRALLERARAGVACRVLVDPIGSPGFKDEVRPALERAGCAVREYKPLADSSVDDLIERNHRKILVVDGELAVTGGFGIWRSWSGGGRTREEWRDSNAVVEGPVVRDLQRAFQENWVQAGGAPLAPWELAAPPPAGEVPAAFVASSANDLKEGMTRTRAERMTNLLIRSARRRLWIANSYFVPSTEILSLLVAKARAGVDVRVLVPGPVHDWRSIRAAQRNGYPELVKAGVQIFEYQPTMMHSKTMLVDDRLVVIGSTNLDPLSLRQMEEGSLLVDDPALARQLEALLLEDFRWSKRIVRPKAGPFAWASRAVLWLLGKL